MIVALQKSYTRKNGNTTEADTSATGSRYGACMAEERPIMTAARVLIYGNAGSGKTTMAREVATALGVPRLCLDHIAWGETAVRRPLDDSLADLRTFIASNPGWVIEGCYGDLIEAALPHCTDLRFLNPGIEVCIQNCHKRPWHPEYCASPEDQQRFLAPLIDFVRQYETRQDEYSLARHRAIFDSFVGTKKEYTSFTTDHTDQHG
jgi:hypothetical protein